MVNLTDTEISKYKSLFKLFNTNKDDKIDISQLELLLCRSGVNVTPQELEVLKNAADPKGKKTIKLKKFLEIMAEQKKIEGTKLAEKRAAPLEACRKFDKGGSGFISVSNLATALGSVGIHLGSQETSALTKKAFIESQGRVSYEDLIDELLKKRK